MGKKNAEIETAVFAAFLSKSGLNYENAAVDSRLPPEPDKICCLAGEGTVGFELTEIVDERLKRRVGSSSKLMMEVKKLIKDEFNIFNQLYGDATIFFSFQSNTTDRQRRKMLPKILEALSGLSSSSEGKFLKLDSRFKSVLDNVQIRRRGRKSGPMVQVNNVGWGKDPLLEVILKKFKKSYECDYPIELLAYFDGLYSFDFEYLGNQLNEIKSGLEKSQFRRIWIFDYLNNEVVYSSDILKNY